MSAWSGIAKALRGLLKGGGASAAAGGASAAVGNGAKVVLTWGNTVKVAVVGGFSYLFLKGGASNVVATALGIPEGVAQVLVVMVFAVLLILALRYLVNYARDRAGLKKEYLQEPIIRRTVPRDPDTGAYDRYGTQRIPDDDRWSNSADHWKDFGGGRFR